MCGIAGWIDRTASGEGHALRMVADSMASALWHRGPDDGGIWLDENRGVALAHRRLAIIDISKAGHQPMRSRCGRYVVVFNGEIYNFRALRAELLADGAHFNGYCDTEVLVETISRRGVMAAVKSFNGMFAFAVWDRISKVLYLCRDRLGEKPLYYGWLGAGFAFASQPKAFTAVPGFSGEIDPEALTALFQFGFVPGPRSIYKGVCKVPAGAVVSLDPLAANGLTRTHVYWSAQTAVELAEANPFHGDIDTASEELDCLLRDAVRLRMEADVPLGAFLSGGIDSSAIVALMQQQSSKPICTFTVDFSEQASEAEHASAIAAHLHTDHHTLHVAAREAMDVVPKLGQWYDEPFADHSQVPTILISRCAREFVTVTLSGDGGDELFCGYNRYVWGNTMGRLASVLPLWTRKPLISSLERCISHGGEAAATAIAGLLPEDVRPVNSARMLRRVIDLLSAADAREIYLCLMAHWPDADDFVNGAIMSRGPDLAYKPTSRLKTFMLLDSLFYLPDDILAKLDRASMAVSLEARVPFLDHRVFEYAMRLPLSIGAAGSGRKRVLRNVLRKYLPEPLYNRPKRGFGAPIRNWLKGPLRGWAEALLDRSALQLSGHLNEERILHKWNNFLSGRENSEAQIWNVLMFQSWFTEQRKAVSAPVVA